MKFRRAIFWTHLVVGISAGLVILSMCATGLLLAFEPQIVDFAERGVRVIPNPDSAARRLNPEALLARVMEASPQTPPTGLSMDADPAAAVLVRLGRERALYVDPYTGGIRGAESKTRGLLHSVEEWHRWLGSRDIGKPVTGAAALAFLGLALSGIYLWWPRNGLGFLNAMVFRKDLQGKARDWNWHTVTGFWCSLYLIMITSTGAVMSYAWANTLLYKAAGSPPPPVQAARAGGNREKRAGRPHAQEAPDFTGLDRLWAIADHQAPGWHTLSVFLPAKPDEPMAFFIQDAHADPARSWSRLSLNRATGEVVKWETYADYNRGRKARAWITPLHTGRAWGWPGQLLNFVVAAGGLFLVWTGFLMAWRRFFFHP